MNLVSIDPAHVLGKWLMAACPPVAVGLLAVLAFGAYGGDCTLDTSFRNACGGLAAAGGDGAGWGGSKPAGGVVERTAGDDDAVVETFQDCPDCPEMVVVPAGSFRMGCVSGSRNCGSDEPPVLQVRIDRPFALSAKEVTFEQWDACAADDGCGGYRPSDEGWGRGTHPVVNVSWEDVQQYVQWLSDQTGASYRLPSESEWEYAARAGSETEYAWGDEIGSDRANCGECGESWNDKRHSAPVGLFAPNAFGLYDMHGNVWEWVEDAYRASYDGGPSDGSAYLLPPSPEKGVKRLRVLRGGSWISSAKHLRSAYRYRYAQDRRYFTNGFRVARTLKP